MPKLFLIDACRGNGTPIKPVTGLDTLPGSFAWTLPPHRARLHMILCEVARQLRECHIKVS